MAVQSPPIRSATLPTKAPRVKISEPTTSTLVICRNKHWRYISSFHGPWLQLPPEVLESLAYSNFNSPCPQPIDPAVFFDIVKIRRLVDEATSLAVRATNGTTSSALSNSLNANNGLYSGGSAAALGIGLGGGGGNTKLSRERKHRMREHATRKLSHAYCLDEIAASVATMQSASALEDVAKHVLQRNADDPDAKYVHFFHEKIPSRGLADCTSLEQLDEVISQRPTEGATYRTRAVTKIFKEDFIGAVKDLTEAIGVGRLYNKQEKERNTQTDLNIAREALRESRADARVDEKDQPSSLEPQLLFHRAGTYLAMACDQISGALHSLSTAVTHPVNGTAIGALYGEETSRTEAPAQKEVLQSCYEARKLVRTYAKRALRDYISFLSHLDYSPGLPYEITRSFLQKVNAAAIGHNQRLSRNRLLDVPSYLSKGNSGALVHRNAHGGKAVDDSFSCSPTTIHPLSSLFSAVPPADIPPYPAELGTLVAVEDYNAPPSPSHPDISEAVTYHPLLTDALHSLLLCHCLIQTSPKEHLRHAYMVARVARICDGYPIFLAARSPARADWVEVVRRSENWLGLATSWEKLCAPASLSGQKESECETAEQRRERKKQDLIREALSDDRVHDVEGFKTSVRAREIRAVQEEEADQREEYLRTNTHQTHSMAEANDKAANAAPPPPPPKRWAQEDGKEYPISTERADAIARWIREVPAPGTRTEDSKGKRAAARKGPRNLRNRASDLSSVNEGGLEKSVESLNLDGEL